MTVATTNIPIIRLAPFALVRIFSAAGARERVSITDTPNTRWWTIHGPSDGRLVGCLGLIAIAGRLRVKGVYIKPADRGHGIGSEATQAVVALALAEGKAVEAFALNPPWYHARGFLTVSHNAHGVALVRREP